jgi:hypothetical protein
MKRRLDFDKFQQYIAKDKRVQKEILEIVRPRMEKSKARLVQNFINHPVSAEIAGGPNAGNGSGTLAGYGNLFSFIGFSSGNPVQQWANFIQKAITLSDKIKVSVSGASINFNLSLASITDQDLKDIAPMPWEGGRSWIKAIETSISGFSFYISKRGVGRSGGGIQSNFSKKSSGSFRSVPYWSKMWSEFLKDISQ